MKNFLCWKKWALMGISFAHYSNKNTCRFQLRMEMFQSYIIILLLSRLPQRWWLYTFESCLTALCHKHNSKMWAGNRQGFFASFQRISNFWTRQNPKKIWNKLSAIMLACSKILSVKIRVTLCLKFFPLFATGHQYNSWLGTFCDNIGSLVIGH